jgi:hypothetical protein
LTLASEEMLQLRWWWIQSGKPDLATQTALAKFGIAFGGIGETLFHPMQSMAVRTLYVHGVHIMNRPVRRKWCACNWKGRRRISRVWMKDRISRWLFTK